MTNNEDFYDKEIAPKLREMADMCKARGMPFLAMVGYDDIGSVGRTAVFENSAPAVIRWANAIGLAWCPGGAVNIDSFMISVMRDQRGKPHSSMILHQLGVPVKPPPADTGSQ